MGAVHSYPAPNNNRSFRPYSQFGSSSSSIQYQSQLGQQKHVPHSQSQKKSRPCDVNNNRPLRSGSSMVKSQSKSTTTTTNSSTTKKHHSALSCGWSLAKRTAAAALPSFLGTNPSLGHAKSSFAQNVAARLPTSGSNSISTNYEHPTIGVYSRTSQTRSSDEEEEELAFELNDCQLDCSNHNDVHFRTQTEKTDTLFSNKLQQQHANGKGMRSQSPQSHESLTLYTNMYSIAEEYRNNVGIMFNEQDLTNNNAGNKKWIVAETPPRRIPRFFNRLMQMGSGNDSNNFRRKSRRSSKRTPSLSCSSSAASSSSESASSYSIFSTSTTNVTTPSYPEDDQEDRVEEVVNGMSAELDGRLDCSLRTLFSQHSFMSPSESFENDFSGTSFGRHEIVSSSTAELLRGLGRYVSDNCKVSQFEPAQLVMWLRSIDRSLMLQGWQDVAFVNPANLVFVYLLIRAQLNREYHKIRTVSELQSLVRTCLFVSYSYMGNEISYPLKPFISQNENRSKFWSRCLQLINLHSDEMLRLNSSTDFFLECFDELRSYADLERC